MVLVDDMSADGTAEVAGAIATETMNGNLHVVNGEPRPSGWAGKPWAMAQGTKYAVGQSPPPEWLLFTDADVGTLPRRSAKW